VGVALGDLQSCFSAGALDGDERICNARHSRQMTGFDFMELN